MSCGMICAHGVSKRYGTVAAVSGARLCVERGEFVALLGPSGCGKTTLLRLVAGFEQPDEGEIEIDGVRVAGPGVCVPPERRRVGMVFQDYALFPHLTVAENVSFGLARDRRRRRLPELLALVGLGGLGARYPHQLSGGQQQRVALARALAPEPGVVLLDEPWSNIDPLRRSEMRDELAAILRAAQVTVVLVTHDREEAFSLADRIALMRDGTVVQAGPPEELYLHPATRWAAEFVGAGNFLPGRVDGALVDTLLGRFPHDNGIATDADGVSWGAAGGAGPEGTVRASTGPESTVPPAASGRGGGGLRPPQAGPARGRRVEVLVRPEQLELELDPAGSGQVVGREFRGHDVFYRVLVDGTLLVSQRPSTEIVPLGARVSVHPHARRVAVFT